MRFGLFVLVLLTFALPLHAGEWKSQSYQDSIIELRTGWDWTKPERGGYWVHWRDDFSVQTHEARWSLAGLPRIGLRIERLAPDYGYWRGSTEEWFKLDEDFLKWWKYLKDSGVSDIVPIKCEARDCVTFTAGGRYRCGAFVNWSGQLNDRNDTDLIGGYFCGSYSKTVTVETLNKTITSLVIHSDLEMTQMRESATQKKIESFADSSDKALCRVATAGGGSRWETREAWLPAVEEAHRRRISVAECSAILAE